LREAAHGRDEREAPERREGRQYGSVPVTQRGAPREPPTLSNGGASNAPPFPPHLMTYLGGDLSRGLHGDPESHGHRNRVRDHGQESARFQPDPLLAVADQLLRDVPLLARALGLRGREPAARRARLR